MELNDNKAGMQGLDKERINAVIRENTGAQYQKHQEKRDQRIQQRIEQNRTRLRELSQEQIDRADKEMDVIAGQLEERRDLSRTIVHVDMDAFYAAVEMRDEPKLRQVPMAVGGDSMLVEAVLAEYDADYTMGSLDEAYLDITDFLAARRSRGLENYRHERKQYSNACKCRLPRLTDMSGVVVARIDEVCQRCRQMQTTVTDTVSFGSSAEDVVAEMRHRIEQTTGLTASAAFGGTVSPQATLAKFFAHQDYHNSVSQTMSNTSGIAPNGMLAKICSDMNKPNGQFVLSPDLQAVKDFVMMLPIRKVGGIGSVTDALLKALDIDTCGDLWSNRGILSLLFSELSASYFLRISMGIGSSFMSTQDSDRKSMSVERTFRPTSDAEELLGTCKKLCDSLANDADEHELAVRVASHLVSEGRESLTILVHATENGIAAQQRERYGKTVTLKIKQSTFDVRTRASTGVHCLSSAEELYIVASKLLKKEIEEACGLLELRLMGVRLSALSPRSSQQILTITKFFSKSPVKNTSVCRDAEVEVIECAASSSTALGSSTDVGQLTADVVDVVDESDGGECENRAVEEDDEATSPPSPLDITCPVCSRRLLKCSTLAEANAHVDDCLSKKEILHVLRKSRTVEKRRAPKMENVSQKGFTAGCLSSNAPSPAAVGTGTDAKRAKPASQGATTPTRPNNTRPLEFYFNKPS